MVRKGLQAWRSMPQARRKHLKSQGIDTRKEKVAFGRKLLRSRRQGTPGPTAKSVTGGANGGVGGAAVEIGGSGGVAPRGLNLERTRKTTTRGGKVGVTRVGMTSGPVSTAPYRMAEPASAQAVADKAGKAGKSGRGKAKAKAVVKPKPKVKVKVRAGKPNVVKRPVQQRKAPVVVRRRRR